MAARPKPPLFLARAVYRRRRLRDAARLLPLIGVFLLMLPMLWRQEAGAGRDWLYLFAVWGLLIGLAAALAPGLAASEHDAEAGPGGDGER